MKRPKLFYTPGLISLLVIPVLFYIYQPAIKTQTVVKILVPMEDDPGQSPYFSRYTRSSVIASLKRKKINTVNLDSNHSLNERKLEFIAQEALKLKFYNDTTQVIKVRYSDETTYNEFVQLVNIMYRDGHKRYSLLDNEFYIFGEDPPEPHIEFKIPYFTCGYVGLKVEMEKTWQERLWEEINKYKLFIVNNGLLLAAFVLLIVIPTFLKIKRRI